MSSTQHVIEIIFRTSGQQTLIKPMTDVNKQTTTLNKNTGTLNKTYTNYTGALTKTRTGALSYGKVQTGVIKTTQDNTKSTTDLAKGQTNLTSSHGKLQTSTNKTGTSMKNLSDKFRENRGLIFGSVGIVAAGIEAVGMYTLFATAADKVAEAQARVNQLEADGLAGTQAHTDAINALQDAQHGYNFILRNTILSFTDLIPFTLMFINSLVKLKTGTDSMKTSTDALNASNAALAATKNQQVIPSIINMGTEVTKTNDLTTIHRENLNLLRTDLGKLTKPFTDLGAKIKDFGTKVLQYFKDLPSGMAGFKKVFSDMGTAVVSGLKKLGTGFKAFGAGVVSVMKKVALSLLTNPITGILVAISVAVSALIFDLGGFRTAINNMGVALGNAVPPLKGVLDAIGGAGNSALDAAAGFLGFETGAKKAEEASKKLKELGVDPLMIALGKFLDLGDQYGNIASLRTQMDILRSTVTQLKEETDFLGKTSVKGYEQILNAFEFVHAGITNKTPEIITAGEEFRAEIERIKNSEATLEERQLMINAALDKYYFATGKVIQVEAQKTKSTQEAEKVTNKYGVTVALIQARIKALAEEHKGEAAELDKASEAVAQYVDKNMKGVEVSDKFINNLHKSAAVLILFGDNTKVATDGTADLIENIKLGEAAQVSMRDAVVDTYQDIITSVANGTLSLSQAKFMIDLLSGASEEFGDIAELEYTEFVKLIDFSNLSLGEQIALIQLKQKTTVEAEKAEKSEIEKKTEKIEEEAKALNILLEIQGWSLEDKEKAIELAKREQKELDSTRAALEDEARARGAGWDVVKWSIEDLQDFIDTHELEIDITADVIKSLDDLKSKRDQDAYALQVEEETLRKLTDQLGLNTYGMELSAKGMQELITLHDDMAQSQKLANDAAVVWYETTLENDKLNLQTIESYKALGEEIGVNIPQDIIDKGIPAIQEYIEEVKGIGDAGKDAAKELNEAFNEMTNEASKAIEELIKEDVLAGKVKKVQKTLEEVGITAESLGALRPIINIAANTQSFEDDINSIPDLVITMFQGLAPQTQEEAEMLMQEFMSGMEDEFGNRMPEVVAAIESLWTYVKTENAGKSAAEQVQIFQDILKSDPAKFAEAVKQGMIDPMTGELTSGWERINSMSEEDLDKLATTLFGKGAKFQNVGGEIILQTAEGIEAERVKSLSQASQNTLKQLENMFPPAKKAAKTGGEEIINEAATGMEGQKMKVQNATLISIVDPVTKEVTKVPALIEEEIKPVSGIFDQAFLDASTLSSIQLAALLLTVQQYMSDMSISVKTYSNSMKVNWTNGILGMSIPLPAFSDLIVALQQTFSDLSTSVATYSNSMTVNVQNFTTETSTNMDELTDNIKTGIWQTFSDLSTSVDTYMISMATNIDTFRTDATEDFDTLQTDIEDGFWQTMSDLSTSVDTYTESMTENIDQFADDAIEDFDRVGESVDDLIEKMEDLEEAAKQAANAQDKVKGASGVRKAQHGGSFIIRKPMKIGNISVGENYKPELLNVIPLSDTATPTGMGIRDISNTPQKTALSEPLTKASLPMDRSMVTDTNTLRNNIATGGNGIIPTINVQVRGDIYQTLMTPDGKTTKKQIAPLIFENVTSVTSR